MELCTDERLDVLARASFGYLVRARHLMRNLTEGLDERLLLHVKPEAPWFGVVAARIAENG